MKIKIKNDGNSIFINQKNATNYKVGSCIYRGNLCNIFKTENGIDIVSVFAATEPVYYTIEDNILHLSSDIKNFSHRLIDKVNYDVFNEFITYGYVFPPATLIKNVYRLPVFSHLEINCYNGILIADLKYDFINKSEKKFKDISSNLLESSKNNEKVSLLFSGGLDSTILAKVFSKKIINYYATGFEFEDCDYIEKEYAKSAVESLNIDLLYKTYDFNELLILLPEVIFYTEIPLNHIQTLLLYKLLRDIPSKEKIILNGQGADALFGTTAQYKYYCGIDNQLSEYKKILQINLSNEKKSMSILDLDYYANIMGDCNITISSWTKLAKYCDKKMIFPFFNKKNYNFINDLPWDVRNCKPKNILKIYAESIKIPQYIIDRKKASFGPVSVNWGEYLIRLIPLCEDIKSINISLMSIKNSEYRYKLWNLVNFSIWYKIFINKTSVDNVKEEIKELLNYGK